jgi:hypothetical protein
MWPRPLEFHCAAASLFQHPLADADDLARLFGNRNERRR